MQISVVIIFVLASCFANKYTANWTQQTLIIKLGLGMDEVHKFLFFLFWKVKFKIVITS